MSNKPNLKSDNFQLVSYKRKGAKLKTTITKLENQNSSLQLPFNREASIRRIQEAKQEISETDLFVSFTALLREGLAHLNNPKISKIICFGLGRIGECLISRFQFGLLLCLRDLYKVDISVFDPCFTESDCLILNDFNCCILKDNVEGKYKVLDRKTTLFYLPHCPKQLSNNLLWANWGIDLNYCIIVANSFNSVIENSPSRVLKSSAEYLFQISPHVLELSVINNFKFYEVFNDTAIHIFPWNKLNLISDDFWKFAPEPKYLEDDVEFITNNLKNNLSLS